MHCLDVPLISVLSTSLASAGQNSAKHDDPSWSSAAADAGGRRVCDLPRILLLFLARPFVKCSRISFSIAASYVRGVGGRAPCEPLARIRPQFKRRRSNRFKKMRSLAAGGRAAHNSAALQTLHVACRRLDSVPWPVQHRVKRRTSYLHIATAQHVDGLLVRPQGASTKPVEGLPPNVINPLAAVLDPTGGLSRFRVAGSAHTVTLPLLLCWQAVF